MPASTPGEHILHSSWPRVSGLRKSFHQQSGVASSHASIYRPIPTQLLDREESADWLRQLDDSSLYQQSGQKKVHDSHGLDPSPVLPGEQPEHDHPGTSHSQTTELSEQQLNRHTTTWCSHHGVDTTPSGDQSHSGAVHICTSWQLV